MGKVEVTPLPPSLWTETDCYSWAPQGSPLPNPNLSPSASNSPHAHPEALLAFGAAFVTCLIDLPLLQTSFSISFRHFLTHGSGSCFCLLPSCQGICDLAIAQLPLRAPGLGSKPLFLAFSGLGHWCSVLPRLSSSFPVSLAVVPQASTLGSPPSCSVLAPCDISCTSWLQLPVTKSLLQPRPLWVLLLGVP